MESQRQGCGSDPSKAGEKRYLICREFKSNDKISNKSVCFYYLYVPPILNTCSDNTCLPEKKKVILHLYSNV